MMIDWTAITVAAGDSSQNGNGRLGVESLVMPMMWIMIIILPFICPLQSDPFFSQRSPMTISMVIKIWTIRHADENVIVKRAFLCLRTASAARDEQARKGAPKRKKRGE